MTQENEKPTFEASPESKVDNLRLIRTVLLGETDALMFLSDVFSPSELEELKKYRQELRDVTSNVDMDNLTTIAFDHMPNQPEFFKDKIGMIRAKALLNSSMWYHRNPVPNAKDAITHISKPD